MAFKYYNEQTGRYEPFVIPVIKGDKGEKGDQGEQGIQGIQGVKGDTGAVFTPSVDANGVISWSNDAGLTNPTPQNIRGPQGIQGPKGETGEQGPKGDKGDPGAASLAIDDAQTTTVSAWSSQKTVEKIDEYFSLSVGFEYLED